MRTCDHHRVMTAYGLGVSPARRRAERAKYRLFVTRHPHAFSDVPTHSLLITRLHRSIEDAESRIAPRCSFGNFGKRHTISETM